MKNQKNIINAWCMYDWANSVHNLVIITVIFPMYYHAVTDNEATNHLVDFFGFKINNDALYTYTISAATFLLVLIGPVLTGVADYSDRKKFFMKFFCYLGAASCMYFYFFTPDTISTTIIAFGMSVLGWGGSVVFYNSFLPLIATEDQYDRISAKGFAFGYIGSVLLLIFNLLMIMKPEWFGFNEEQLEASLPARISFLTVGIWWAAFAQIPFYYLPKDSKKPFERKWIKKGFNNLKRVFIESQKNVLLKKFLMAFFIYTMGVMTVIYVAALFADKELEIPKDGLIITLLLIQLIAIPGSYFSSFLSRKWGNTVALRIIIFIWALVPIAAYFTYSAEVFYGIAAVVGLVMGGIQSLSRSTYAKLIPDNAKDTASYFSFYDITEKLATSIGTFGFGLITQATGTMRNSILLLIVLFIVGYLLLFRIPSKRVY